MAKAKQLPSGSWRVQLYIGMQDGKRVYRSFTGPSKRQVEAEAAAYAATEPLSIPFFYQPDASDGIANP